MISINDAANALSCLVVVLGVDALHVVNVFDELLVRLRARLDSEVGEVVLNRLHVGLHESVDLHEGKERVHSDAAEVEHERATNFLNPNYLIKQTDFHEALV